MPNCGTFWYIFTLICLFSGFHCFHFPMTKIGLYLSNHGFLNFLYIWYWVSKGKSEKYLVSIKSRFELNLYWNQSFVYFSQFIITALNIHLNDTSAHVDERWRYYETIFPKLRLIPIQGDGKQNNLKLFKL